MPNDQQLSAEDAQAYRLITDANTQLDISQITSTLPAPDEGYILDTGYRDMSHPVTLRLYDK